MPDERLISSSRISANDVGRHSFDTVRRGFDPREVRAFLELVARELHAREEVEQEYRRELREAQEQAKHPVLDEATLTAALGQQTAQVLRHAHEQAAQIMVEAEQQAAAVLREAQHEVTETKVRAEAMAAERIAEGELAASALRQQAEQEAQQLLASSRHDGETIAAKARDRGREMIEEAQAARKRVVADLSQRRRAFQLQIEQLRAARDDLAAAVLSVRDKAERIATDLAHTDDHARQAAVEARERAQGDVTEPVRPEGEEALGAHQSPAESEAAVSLPAPGDADGPLPAPSRADDAPASEGSSHEVAESPTDPQSAAALPEEPASEDRTEKATLSPAIDPHPSPESTGSIDSQSLEELFARIRQSQRTVSAGPAASATHETTGSEGPPSSEEAAGGEEAKETDLTRRRDDDLAPVNGRLARSLKRALQDEQNRLLDALRSSSGTWSGDLLPSEADHRARYASSSTEALRQAVAAGTRFAGSVTGTSGSPPNAEEEIGAMADDLAGTVVALLRRRLPGGDEAPSPDDMDDASEVVGAAFREWRGARVERLVGDYTLQAFGVGELSATNGSGVRWVPGGGGAPCADCEDNCLAGVLQAGEDFPTGQPCPPAHAGCRCLLVPGT